MSPRPSWAISSCEKSGNSTWMPPIELRVQCIECVTTAFTSCKSKFQFNQSSINRLSCHQPRIFCTGHVRQASCCCSFSSSAPSTPYDLCVVYPRNYYKIYWIILASAVVVFVLNAAVLSGPFRTFSGLIRNAKACAGVVKFLHGIYAPWEAYELRTPLVPLRPCCPHLLLVCHLLTCNISACGVCTKYETFPLGDDCRHNWPSVATGLYMNTMAFDSLPSYSTCGQEDRWIGWVLGPGGWIIRGNHQWVFGYLGNRGMWWGVWGWWECIWQGLGRAFGESSSGIELGTKDSMDFMDSMDFLSTDRRFIPSQVMAIYLGFVFSFAFGFGFKLTHKDNEEKKKKKTRHTQQHTQRRRAGLQMTNGKPSSEIRSIKYPAELRKRNAKDSNVFVTFNLAARSQSLNDLTKAFN